MMRAPWAASIFYPQGAAFSAPVYLFVTGFGGEASISDYDTVLSAIAAHGLVVVGVDRGTKLAASMNYTELAESLDGSLAYISTSLPTDLKARSGPPRTSGLLLGGHSAGNHVAEELVEHRGVSFG